jgi:hypothetical protein
VYGFLLWSDRAVDKGSRSHAEVGDGRLLEQHLRHGAALQVSIFGVWGFRVGTSRAASIKGFSLKNGGKKLCKKHATAKKASTW